MPLFGVPGWHVPDVPVKEKSKKRKRPSEQDAEKHHGVEVNIEKLMAKISEVTSQTDKRKNRKVRRGEHARVEKLGSATKGKSRVTSTRGVPENGERKGGAPGISSSGTPSARDRKSKKRKEERHSETNGGHDPPSGSVVSDPSTMQEGYPKEDLTALQSAMKNSLDGARFRWINETLYKSDSGLAHNMMRQDPSTFHEYHKGFRRQVESWPKNPVVHYISEISSYLSKTVIADLGCGDAALARALIPKGYNVLSFDLVSDGVFVTEADIFSRLPLPGSEGSSNDDKGQGQIVDVVVCALSLMGTNWPSCIREAWRILRTGGELKIAEVASRFKDVEAFTSLIVSIGFELVSTDDQNTHFTLFEFKKMPRKSRSPAEWSKLLSQGSLLKPCEYKRR